MQSMSQSNYQITRLLDYPILRSVFGSNTAGPAASVRHSPCCPRPQGELAELVERTRRPLPEPELERQTAHLQHIAVLELPPSVERLIVHEGPAAKERRRIDVSLASDRQRRLRLEPAFESNQRRIRFSNERGLASQ